MGQRPPNTPLPSTGRESREPAPAWESREPSARPLPGERRTPGTSARHPAVPAFLPELFQGADPPSHGSSPATAGTSHRFPQLLGAWCFSANGTARTSPGRGAEPLLSLMTFRRARCASLTGFETHVVQSHQNPGAPRRLWCQQNLPPSALKVMSGSKQISPQTPHAWF